MKTIKVILIVLTAILSGTVINAQDDSKFGDDPEMCRVKLSTYDQFYKQNNIKDAIPAWRWCFINCPASTKNIYIHGTSIVDYMINNTEDTEIREKYVDTLLMVYDQRIEYFGEEGRVLGRKANDMLKYRSQEVTKIYEMYKTALELEGIETERSVLGNLMNVSVALYKNDIISDEEVVENYAKISENVDMQIEQANAAGKNKDVARLNDLMAIVEDIFVNSGAANCEAIINLYTPKFQENPDDVDMLKKILYLLEKGGEDECKLSDLYSQVAEKLFEIEKSTTAAHSLGQLFFKLSESQKAEKYYLEAIEMSMEDKKLADLYYELALLYYSQMQNFPRAREYARKALGIDPNYGRAYSLIGKIYAASISDCSETELEQWAMYWLIVDQFVKAKSVDNSENLVKEANEYISIYSARFPTTEKLFWYDTNVGQSVNVGCWINETTTVRTSN